MVKKYVGSIWSLDPKNDCLTKEVKKLTDLLHAGTISHKLNDD